MTLRTRHILILGLVFDCGIETKGLGQLRKGVGLDMVQIGSYAVIDSFCSYFTYA